MTTVSGEYFGFTLHSIRLAVPLSRVERVIHAVAVSQLPDLPSYICGVFDFFGEVVPVLNLGIRFGFPMRKISPDQVFILVNTPVRKIALIADSAEGVIFFHPVDLKSGSELDRGISAKGLVSTPEGIVLIYDVEQFLAHDDLVRLNEVIVNLAEEGPIT